MHSNWSIYAISRPLLSGVGIIITIHLRWIKKLRFRNKLNCHITLKSLPSIRFRTSIYIYIFIYDIYKFILMYFMCIYIEYIYIYIHFPHIYIIFLLSNTKNSENVFHHINGLFRLTLWRRMSRQKELGLLLSWCAPRLWNY